MANKKLENKFIIIDKSDRVSQSSSSRVRVYEDEVVKQSRERATAIAEIDDAIQSLVSTLESATGGRTVTQMMNMGKAVNAIGSVTKAALMKDVAGGIKAIGEAGDGLAAIADTFLSLAIRIDEVGVKTARTTGYTDAYKKEIFEIAVAAGEANNVFSGLALTLEEVGEIQSTLNNTFKLFPTLTKSARNEAVRFAAEFNRLGVEVGQTGQTFDLLTKGMGILPQNVSEVTSEFYKFSQQTGQALSDVVSNFNQLGPQLARYGDQAREVFKDLSAEARMTGLDVEKAFTIANMADTFEGAADLAGKLNAQLGLRLTSTELLRAEEAERLQIIRDEFMMRRNFDDLNRRERQAIAEIFGTGVDEARKLLTDPTALEAFQKQSLAQEEAARMQTAQMEKFNAALESFLISMTGAIDIATGFINFLGSATGGTAAFGVGILAAIKGGPAMLSALLKRKGMPKMPLGKDITYHAEGSKQLDTGILRGGPNGFFQPMIPNDYTVTTPGGDVFAGTELFGPNSAEAIENMQSSMRQSMAPSTTKGATFGSIASIFARTPLGGAIAAIGDLGITAAEGGDMKGSLARTIGMAIGGVLGTAIPIPGVGTGLGMYLGRMAGDALVGSAAEDAIVRDGKVTKAKAGSYTVTGPGMRPFSMPAAQSGASSSASMTAASGAGAKEVADAVYKAVIEANKASDQNRKAPTFVAQMNGREMARFMDKRERNRLDTLDPSARGVG